MIVEKVPKAGTITTGFLIIKPQTYSATKKYPLVIFLHGVGGRGDGSANPWGLEALISRGELPVDLQDAVDTYGFILAAPQISGDWNNSETELIISYALTNLPVDPKQIHLTGVSLGGGGVLRYITGTAPQALKLATATPICPVAWGTNYAHVVNTNLPVWLFHAANDTTVPPANSTNARASINALNPTIKAELTLYRSGGHSIWGEVYKNDIPANPANATEFNNPSVTWYQWIFMNISDVPIAVPRASTTGSSTSTTTKVPIVISVGPDITDVSPLQVLQATANVPIKEAYWSLVSTIPGDLIGKNSIQTSPGGSYAPGGRMDVRFNYPGTYKFNFKMVDGGQTYDAPSQKTVNILTSTTSTTTTSTTNPITSSTTTTTSTNRHLVAIVYIYSNGDVDTIKPE